MKCSLDLIIKNASAIFKNLKSDFEKVFSQMNIVKGRQCKYFLKPSKQETFFPKGKIDVI